MSAHADTLPPSDHLSKPFWVSMTLHAAFLGSLTIGGVLHTHIAMGSPTGGGMGVLVNPVASIPLPNQGGAENPVANDTKSQVPTPPAPKEKPKVLPKEKAPPADAVPLKSNRTQAKKQAEPQSAPNKFTDSKPRDPDRLYSTVGQRASSDIYHTPGGGGVGLGDNSPFGDQFGTYANIIRDSIARNWNPMKVGSAVSVVVTFTIHRDGSVSNVQVTTRSGNPTLDFSAQRAVLDAQLPALPDKFPRNQADVTLRFELGN